MTTQELAFWSEYIEQESDFTSLQYWDGDNHLLGLSAQIMIDDALPETVRTWLVDHKQAFGVGPGESIEFEGQEAYFESVAVDDVDYADVESGSVMFFGGRGYRIIE